MRSKQTPATTGILAVAGFNRSVKSGGEECAALFKASLAPSRIGEKL
jgi:hypothetical protein